MSAPFIAVQARTKFWKFFSVAERLCIHFFLLSNTMTGPFLALQAETKFWKFFSVARRLCVHFDLPSKICLQSSCRLCLEDLALFPASVMD